MSIERRLEQLEEARAAEQEAAQAMYHAWYKSLSPAERHAYDDERYELFVQFGLAPQLPAPYSEFTQYPPEERRRVVRAIDEVLEQGSGMTLQEVKTLERRLRALYHKHRRRRHDERTEQPKEA